jgi:acyl carrier protein
MSDNVEQTIKDIVIKILHCPEDKLKPDMSWKDLEADSLDLVQILVALEDTFGIEISDEDAQGLKNFGDTIRYVEEHKTK